MSTSDEPGDEDIAGTAARIPDVASRIADANSAWAGFSVWQRPGGRHERLMAELGVVLAGLDVLFVSVELRESSIDSDSSYALSLYTDDLLIHTTGNAEHLWATVNVMARSQLTALAVTTAPAQIPDDEAAAARMSVELHYPSATVVLPGEPTPENQRRLRNFLPSLLQDLRN